MQAGGVSIVDHDDEPGIAEFRATPDGWPVEV